MLVCKGHLFHMVPGELPFIANTPTAFVFTDNGIEIISLQTEGHTPALQKSPIIVPGKPGIACYTRQVCGNLLVGAHVEERIHHTRL